MDRRSNAHEEGSRDLIEEGLERSEGWRGKGPEIGAQDEEKGSDLRLVSRRRGVNPRQKDAGGEGGGIARRDTIRGSRR